MAISLDSWAEQQRIAPKSAKSEVLSELKQVYADPVLFSLTPK